MMQTRSDLNIKETIEAIREEIRRAKKILVTSHIRPDGDAVGSLIGLGLALMNEGKTVDMVLEDGVPENFVHLHGSEMVISQFGNNYDLVIVLDCSDLNRVGSFLSYQFQADINIDHHITNLFFAKINLVITEAAATAEILAELIPELGLTVDQSIANSLLNGIVTDTIGFRTANVSPDTLLIAADLVKTGADISTVYHKGLSERSFNGARYWGFGLTKLSRQDGLVWTNLTLEDRMNANYLGNDDADLINVLSSIEGAKIAIIFVEQQQGRVKISWRVCGLEQSDLDVSQIAQKFGGGGHKSAAGAIIEGSLGDVQKMVLEKTQSIL
jgi:bifunctional oligoribonuclease and PAP phosphatase NrnA